MTTLSRPRSLRARFSAFAAVLQASQDCAAAVTVGRQPSRSSLIALGIDPATFPRLRR